MRTLTIFLSVEYRAHPLLYKVTGLACCAAFGSALPDLLAIVGVGR